MNHFDLAALIRNSKKNAPVRLACAGLVVLVAAGLSACGGEKAKKPGQALASVNGEEVTILQLNEELQRSGAQPAQQATASKQLLEALIDRQLLQSEAAKDKTDRDPKVMQAIERAKALIVAQAYMQKRVGNVAKPAAAEVEDYFNKNPGFFSQRKQFDMRELIVGSADVNDELKAAMDAAKSLEEVAAWLDAHKVKFTRTQLSRTSADLAPELSGKLLAMPKGQLFIIKEGERSMLISIAEIKDAPVTLEVAKGQIEQFLFNKRNKEAADAELARLRAAAKIEYFNKGEAAPAPAAAAAKPAAPAADSNARGVAGLK
ncbi:MULTISPECIES: EpsD family peptidyl-prolyl cis-trans isomerase [unclassified Janthinobacterium]|uniref:EpsD family peptidyl-prolyl cis-trans isomerase n=1 Tax=unclassified Janthinobacterium TaxID=2610881 RepID=UPI000475E971|nr:MULTISPECIES: EpsD family peptidyl-prolyl cis-trans isomerase [unclassified Janthinobacterium]MEC5163519.1 peptidyl-prolyl cis-trans isomerase C [Janthinobacterium sp. CG_S6]